MLRSNIKSTIYFSSSFPIFFFFYFNLFDVPYWTSHYPSSYLQIIPYLRIYYPIYNNLTIDEYWAKFSSQFPHESTLLIIPYEF